MIEISLLNILFGWLKFYLDNEDMYFNSAIGKLGEQSCLSNYPEMRLVDIVMWQAGYLSS